MPALDLTHDVAGEDAADDSGFRQCGRCRAMLPVEGEDATAISDWWVCGECRQLLMPNASR